jgi:hypothetical protein
MLPGMVAYLSAPAAWSGPALAMPASAGPAVAHLWRALGWWLAALLRDWGGPEKLLASGVSPRHACALKARIKALECLLRSLVHEAAMRLAAAAPAAFAQRLVSPRRPAPAADPAPPEPAAPAAPADPADPSTWRVGFVWLAVDSLKPPRRFRRRARGVRIWVLDPDTPLRLGPPPAPARPARTFTGQFAPGPAPAFPRAELHPSRAASRPAPISPARHAGDLAAELGMRLAGRLEALRRIAAAPEPWVKRLARRHARAGETERRRLTVHPRPLHGGWRRKQRPPEWLQDAQAAWLACLDTKLALRPPEPG